MRISELKVGGHYALEIGGRGRARIVECFVLEPKGWKANRRSGYGYRGEQRPVREAGAGGTAVLYKEYSSWSPMVVNCSKIVRKWDEHQAMVQASQERARRERLAAERARARRDELTPYVHAAGRTLNMRFNIGYGGSVTVSLDDLVNLLGGEEVLRLAHGETVRAERAQREEEQRQRAEAERARQAALEAERQAAEARRQAELEAERTAGPMASELVSGEVQ